MTAVLSQDEIDQLLTAINAGDTEPEDIRPAADRRKIKTRCSRVQAIKKLVT